MLYRETCDMTETSVQAADLFWHLWLCLTPVQTPVRVFIVPVLSWPFSGFSCENVSESRQQQTVITACQRQPAYCPHTWTSVLPTRSLTQLNSESEKHFLFSFFKSDVSFLFWFSLLSQCAAVPQWAWRSSRWTRRHWWWAGNAPWLSTTHPSPATPSPTAGWNATLRMKVPSPRPGTRAWWVSSSAACTGLWLVYRGTDGTHRITGWLLDQWVRVQEMTSCDELCVQLLVATRAWMLPCHSPV